MSWFSSFMHPGRAYENAQNAEEGYYNQAQGYRQPYINRGETGGKAMEDMMTKLMNPGELQNEWSQGYTTSPYAKQMQQEAQTGGMDAASAMGLGGSSGALANIQKGSADIVQKDRQQYMDDMMKKYMAAMGLGESLYGTGANAAGQAAQGAQQMGQDTANLTYGKNQAGGNMFGKIGSGAFSALMAALTGGGMGGGMTSGMYGGS